MPLRATVRVISEPEWAREVDRESKQQHYEQWSEDLLAAAEKLKKEHGDGDWADELKAETGLEIQTATSEDLLRATFARRMSNASAKVFYAPAMPDEAGSRFRADRHDAQVQITLKMDSEAMRAWDAQWTGRLGAHVPACTVVAHSIRFSEGELDEAFSGVPTWASFVNGRFEAPSEYFRVSIEEGWAELRFDD